MNKYKHFKFWCQHVLPLVYDDSLSYYELLCKVIHYINDMVDGLNLASEDIAELQEEISEIQYKLDNFDTEFIDVWLKEHLASMIFVEINDDGYIVYYIPDSWEEITFNTTGLDIYISGVDSNHLVLSY